MQLQRFLPPALAALAALLAPAGGRAQDEKTYDLLGPGPKKGQVITKIEKVSIKDGKATVDDGGNTTTFGLKLSGKTEKKLEVLEVKGRQVVKARLEIVSDETNTTVNIAGDDKEDAKKGELVGETVLLERIKDGWKRTLADTRPTEAQRAKLDELDIDEWDEALLPDKKVAVGHKWAPDVAKLKHVFGARVNKITGTIKGHFKGVEKVAGQECAVIEFDLDVKATKEDKKETTTLELKGKATTYRALALGINLKEKAGGTITANSKIKAGGKEIEQEIQGKMTVEISSKVK